MQNARHRAQGGRHPILSRASGRDGRTARRTLGGRSGRQHRHGRTPGAVVAVARPARPRPDRPARAVAGRPGMSLVIDAHQHFWDPARADYPWMAGHEMAPIRRAFSPTDLAPLLRENRIGASILVQCRASLAETEEFLGIADRTPFVAGVVGWVDLTDPAVGDTIDRLGALPGGSKLIGIRHQVHDEPDADWLSRSDVQRGIAAVVARDLTYDFLVRTRELPAAIATARAHPQGRFVLDHAAKPP